MSNELKPRSYVITDGPDRAAARTMLMFGDGGLSPEDLDKPIIGVANTWIEIGPCNFHLRRLAAKVKQGIRDAGGTPLEFNTVSISDGITMGTEGMKTSLISREIVADSIELVSIGNMFDAVVALCGCDKTVPGTVMALARLDIPSLTFYGGSIMPGNFQGRDVTIQDIKQDNLLWTCSLLIADPVKLSHASLLRMLSHLLQLPVVLPTVFCTFSLSHTKHKSR